MPAVTIIEVVAVYPGFYAEYDSFTVNHFKAPGTFQAKNIWKETAQHLGRGLVMVINVFDPEVIVVGGGMIGAGEFLFKPLRDYIRMNALSVPAKKVKIVKAKLGNDAGVIGAAELARENN